MALIAMTREMGSLGMDVARILEDELGVPLVYHEIIDSLSDKMRLRKSHVIRLLEGKANLFEKLTADKTSLSIFTAGEILETACKGAVLRGWGASHLLRPVAHAIRVRICAPLEVRVQRMQERLKSADHDAVAAEIRINDEAQGAIAKRHFGVDWMQPENYELCLNTERMSVEQCADKVIRVARDPRFAETEGSRQVLADITLHSKVVAALRIDRATRALAFLVEAKQGRVTIQGMVGTAEDRANAERVAVGVPGASAVDNQLRAISEIHRPVRE
ncbi:MAG: BON domain-containing protein [Betaproteobacteria bacterium]|nr:BON domain-containing protein [Betaproteobacteria bacterium]